MYFTYIPMLGVTTLIVYVDDIVTTWSDFSYIVKLK